MSDRQVVCLFTYRRGQIGLIDEENTGTVQSPEIIPAFRNDILCIDWSHFDPNMLCSGYIAVLLLIVDRESL